MSKPKPTYENYKSSGIFKSISQYLVARTPTVYNSNFKYISHRGYNDARYTFARPKLDCSYMKVLGQIVYGPADLDGITAKEAFKLAFGFGRGKHGGCSIFAGLHNAGLVEYSKKTRKWLPTLLGIAFYEEVAMKEVK
jgi:hypothetical protein